MSEGGDLTLTGAHPYLGAVAPDVSVTLRVLPALPGPEVLRVRETCESRVDRESGWVPLTGPLGVDSPALLGLVWDLEGRPFCLGGWRRSKADFCLVDAGRCPKSGGRRVRVFRAARECALGGNYESSVMDPGEHWAGGSGAGMEGWEARLKRERVA